MVPRASGDSTIVGDSFDDDDCWWSLSVMGDEFVGIIRG